MDELKVFTGNAYPMLAEAVCEYLGIPLGKAEVFEFSNENIFVRILENVRERDVRIVPHPAVPVATTQARRFDLDDDPIRVGCRIGDSLNRGSFLKLFVNDRFHASVPFV